MDLIHHDEMVTLRPHRWTLLLSALVAGAALAGAAAGVLAARHGSPGGGPVGGVGERLAAAAGAQAEQGDRVATRLPLLRTADPAIEFPAPLQDLPTGPYKLAVDPATGHLWFVLFDKPTTSKLYRYDPAAGTLESFDIPASNGSGLFSAIAVDERGHVIWGEGQHVVDFDPASATYREFPLPAQGSSAWPMLNVGGTDLTDMELDGAGHAYVSRMYVAAITDVDLKTGRTREIPFPESFGPAWHITLAEGSVWMTFPANLVGGPSSQTARLELASGRFTVVRGTTTNLAAGPGGRVYGVGSDPPGVVAIADSGVSLVADGLDPAAAAELSTGLGSDDVLAVDGKTGNVWVKGGTGLATGIVRFDPGSGSVRTYTLPSYLVQPICAILQPGQGCDKVEAGPCVDGLAIAPNGDVFFSDACFARIGVIRAGQ